jgi:maltose alpha-D-glucosyltransferase/alpha-amylase
MADGMIRQEGKATVGEDSRLWYKDAVIYELHVRAFLDSNGDGIGDFSGLTQKLDYLRDLGVTSLWLLPFCPSPLRDDGYDSADYTGIHPDYGTLSDFKTFLREAHRRNLRVITELVLNHTSDQHPWFQRARRAKPGSPWRDFYVWSDTPDRYKEARIIFKDFESSNWAWDPVAKAYYWHRFYSHQPDLNYDSPQVQKAVLGVLDFWFGMGVDGLRLDAVPYLYEREGTNCENLSETYEFLRKLRGHVDGKYGNRLLLAEANQWPEDAVAYFGTGDICHMAYHFPLMPRLFMAIRMEDRFPIIDILQQTPEIPQSSQWAMFLRNHDELTLEMVTDEERDYMYRVYASDPRARINLGIRRRLAPLLGNHRRRMELMNGLLLSMPGSPIIYYGDEIGMGDNIYLGDRNGVRTPMQWSADRNAGFSRANSQRLYLPIIIDPEYHYEAVNVEAQQNNHHSLLWWMKRLIALRKRYKAFGRGSLSFLAPENRKVLAFIRRYQDESILVVANLSRFVQYVELDLSGLAGMVPVEIFGRTPFPAIGNQPYFLTLGPHSFYWFILEPQAAAREKIDVRTVASQLPLLTVSGRWGAILAGKARAALEEILPEYLRTRRWFGGKARHIKAATIREVVPVPNADSMYYLTFVKVEYGGEEAETYALPIAYGAGEKRTALLRNHPEGAIARLQLQGESGEGVLYDALLEPGFCAALLEAIARPHKRRGREGEFVPMHTRVFREIRGPENIPLAPALLQAEQSNTSVVYGDRFILKLFRRLEPGENPDLEIGRFLTAGGFPHIPPVAGALEYRKGRAEMMTLAVLQGFVPNQGDAWKYTSERLSHYFEAAMARRDEVETLSLPQGHPQDLMWDEPPRQAVDTIGPYLESARLLGRRTGELHLALASAPDDPAFAPEPFSKLYQRSLYQSMRSLTGQVLQLLRRNLSKIPEGARGRGEAVLGAEGRILQCFNALAKAKITAMRLRCHGDYHLGQVLVSGKDFVIMDFEGEPARPLSERRIKRSPLRDVAGMLRSFHYATYNALFALGERGLARTQDLALVQFLAEFWYLWVSAAFLKAYFDMASRGSFLPKSREELRVLMDAYLLEKVIYEIGYELNNRPDWVKIPLQGALSQLRTSG